MTSSRGILSASKLSAARAYALARYGLPPEDDPLAGFAQKRGDGG
jgi:hypothetical protein